MSFFLNANKRGNAATLEMAIKNYILELLDLVTVFKLVYLQQNMKVELEKNVNLLKKPTYYMYHRTLEHDLES